MVAVVREIHADEATFYFKDLPLNQQIATLEPAYVLADATRDKTLKPTFLIYREGKKFWMTGFHMRHIPNSEYFDISSPYNYGGQLSNSLDQDFLSRAAKAYTEWCHDHWVVAELIKLHPMLVSPYSGFTEFNRMVYGCGEQEIPSCRYAIRKAIKAGLYVVNAPREEIVTHFAGDYRESMRDMKAAEFYHFDDEYFTAISKLDSAVLLVCQDDNGWKSAAILLAGGLSMEYHLSVTNKKGKALGASNLLLYEAREKLHHTCPLYLGGGRTAAPDDSLAKFKASFGGWQYKFYIGWQIHRPDVYEEMRKGTTTDRVLSWRT